MLTATAETVPSDIRPAKIQISLRILVVWSGSSLVAFCIAIDTKFLHTDNEDLSGPEVIKLFSCSSQLSLKFVLLINRKLLTIASSFLLNTAEHENFSANKYENANYSWHFHIY